LCESCVIYDVVIVLKNSCHSINLLNLKNAQLGDLPFFNIQTSNFTATNLVAYSTNGTLTVTDPTPETNKGYIVHVVGGTTTIDGVDYSAGALVYRFYNGTSWTSKDYGSGGSGGSTNLSNTPSPTGIDVNSSTGTGTTLPLANATNAGLLSPSEKIAIGSIPKYLYLDSDYYLIEQTALQPIFDSQEFTFEADKIYEFEALINVTTDGLNPNLFFGMLGDVAECEVINYVSNVADNQVGTGGIGRYGNFTTFASQELSLGFQNYDPIIQVKGTFKTINAGAIQPAIGFDFSTSNYLVKAGAFFKINKLIL